MATFGGPADWWTDGTDAGRKHIATKGIVQNGLVLNLDAGVSDSYPGSGNTWYDLSGNGNNAKGGVMPSFSSNYSSFDGADDYMYLENLNYGNSNRISKMSIFAWIRTTYNSGTIGVWNNNNWSIVDFDRSEVFTFTVNGTGEVQMSGRDNTNNYFDIVGNTRCNDGNWHYIGWTYNSSTNKIIMYVDGDTDRTFSYGSLGSLGTGGSTRYGIIGDGSESSTENGSRNSIHYSGDISIINFYDNKVLTQQEILQNFNATRGRFGI